MGGLRVQMVAAAVAVGLLALGGCATGPDVRSMADPSVRFEQYQRFAFVDPLGTDRSGYQSIVSQQLKAAARREMEARGFRYDPASPELLVNFSGRLSDKVRVTSMPAPPPMGGYYGYRRGFYQPWPAYEQTTVSNYKEGTLTVDVIDAVQKRLVWEGTVTGSVTDSQMRNVEAALNAAVASAFSRFPVAPRAAGG